MVVRGIPVDTGKAKNLLLGTWGQAVFLLLIVLGVYFQTWVDIWPYWENKNATYTHGTLVALVVVWLVWRERPTVNQIELKPSMRAIPVLLLLSALWLLAERANIFIVYASLWPLLAFVTLWVGLGMPAASRFAFPLSFLYFAIPIWDYLKPPLQAITSTMAGLLTSLLGVPAVFDGPYVTLPTATIFIAEDCSGAHFLSVALAVGVLAGVLRGDVLRTRILILVVAGMLSMAFNWLRIVLIVLAYLHPGLRDALETMGHLTFGWWVFALDLLVFSLVLRLVPRNSEEHAETRHPGQTTIVRSSNRAGVWIAAVALVLLPAAAWVLPRVDSNPTEIPRAGLTITATGNGLQAPDLRWTPHYPGAAWEDRFATVTEGGDAVEVYANQYHEQTQGSELIARGSYLFDPLYFTLKSSSLVTSQDSTGQSISARREILADKSGASWLVLYTYLVDSDAIVSSRRVQLMTTLRSIYTRTTAGVVAVTTPCAGECESRVPDVEGTFIRALEDYREKFRE